MRIIAMYYMPPPQLHNPAVVGPVQLQSNQSTAMQLASRRSPTRLSHLFVQCAPWLYTSLSSTASSSSLHVLDLLLCSFTPSGQQLHELHSTNGLPAADERAACALAALKFVSACFGRTDWLKTRVLAVMVMFLSRCGRRLLVAFLRAVMVAFSQPW